MDRCGGGVTTHGTGRRLKSGTCEGTKSSAQGIVEKTWSRAQLWGCCQWLLSDAILRRDELILKEELLAMLPMRPECSQMISAPYPGRLPGEGGGLLLSQQLGHLVLFLQRMPSETSSLAFRRRTGRCDCSAPRITRCAPVIVRQVASDLGNPLLPPRPGRANPPTTCGAGIVVCGSVLRQQNLRLSLPERRRGHRYNQRR